MKVCDARHMRSIDGAAVKAYGLRGLQLMENAGRGLAEAVKKEATGLNPRVAVIAGKGSNGGDGYAAARHLKNSGFHVEVFSLARIEDLKGDALINARAWQKMGELFFILTPAQLKKHVLALRHSSVIVDAIFGTGLSSPVRGISCEVINLINRLGKKVVAADVPSGVDASTGRTLGCAVMADVTATMALMKIGLLLYPGRSLAGRVDVVDIGVPLSLLEDERIRWNIIEDADMRRILRPREVDAHKGAYGHLLVIAGSPGKTGAAYMSSMGAMRAGTGLVTLGIPRSLNPAMEAKTTEVMTAPLAQTAGGTLGTASYEGIRAAAADKSALCIGPGLGKSADIFSLLKKIMRGIRLPVVIDADGLNVLEGNLSLLKEAGGRVVITPHPGEAARLLGSSAADVQADRLGAAERLAQKSGAIVALKGASTVVAAPDRRVWINPTGNAGLSTAGTGDVLSGMIGGLLAAGYPPLDAAIAAVYMHGLAADELKKNGIEAGMMATDLLPVIPRILNFFIARSDGRQG
ncbi:MAG: NAD(P)H-hydrate dehydratase [Deltaproteobacteria bacterium]|nr:NAD(P)H-hydrate dehydratase [Deltaproteobacteria bacterium]